MKELWEEQSVELAGVWEWPFKHCNNHHHDDEDDDDDDDDDDDGDDDDDDDDDDVDDDDDDDDAKCHEMTNVNIWLQAETNGVTHFGAYNRPQDGHFFTSSDFGSFRQVW